MNPMQDRRQFLRTSSIGLGSLALASLMNEQAGAARARQVSEPFLQRLRKAVGIRGLGAT